MQGLPGERAASGAPVTSGTDAEAGARWHYVPALDGLRAFAVAAVVLYHGGIPWAPGGFLGVDVFFVLSGFLITTLLLGEYRQTGSVRLRAFWARRARRLLPALLAMLVGVGIYAEWLAPAGSLGQLRHDALATLFYFANWNQIFTGQGYFSALQAPSPLIHTWSLAIEEQFYIVWPLVVLSVLRLTRSPRALALLAGSGALASAVAMGVLYDNGLGLNRVYYGTDTRAQDLLIGAVLAVMLARAPRHARRGHGRARDGTARASSSRWALLLTGGLGLAFVCFAVVEAGSSSAWLYEGGFAAVSVGTALLLACLVLVPSSPWAKLFSLSPIRYVGRISYGIYLWHWPLFVVLDPERTGLGRWPLFAVRVACTMVLSIASYHLLEIPIRRGMLQRWTVRLVTPAAVGATAALLVLSTASPVAAAGSQVSQINAAAASLPAGVDRVGPGTSPGTTSITPDVAAGTGGPIRLLLVGDSEAAFLAFGLAPGANQYGIEYAGDGVINCGLLHQGPVMFRGEPAGTVEGFRDGSDPVLCSSQLERWKNDVDTYHPDVVALEEGELETRSHLIDGTWMRLGQPAFDRIELHALDQAVGVLGSTGAEVVLLTAPYYRQTPQVDGQPWPEDDPALVDSYNKLLAQVASTHRANVAVEQMGRRLDPHGRYTAIIDGQQMRRDGIHLTPAGGRYVQPWLLPRIASLGEMVRARAQGAASSPAQSSGTTTNT